MVHLHDDTDGIGIGIAPLVSLGQGEYTRDYPRAAEKKTAQRFELQRRDGLIGRWLPWRRAASRLGAEGLAEARVREEGDSVAVEDTRPDGTGPRRVEFIPGTVVNTAPRRRVVVE
jgi:hypothetical protein